MSTLVNYVQKCIKVLMISVSMFTAGIGTTSACSEIFVDGKYPVSARTFDFMFGGGEAMFSPRGVKRQSFTIQPDQKAYSWTSNFGSITFSAAMPMKDGTTRMTGVDGINEAGFKIGTYYLPESNMPEGNGGTVLNIGSIVQYAVDRFATVDGFIADLQSGHYRVISMPTTAVELKLHMYVHDANGQSAIIEYINGKLDIIHNPEVPVLTNTPYRETIDKLKSYQEFGGDKTIPGTHEALDRFIRGAFYEKHIPTSDTAENALASANAALMTLTMPPVFKYGCTYWHLVTDMKNKTIYIQTLNNRKLRWITLDKMDFSEGRDVKILDFQDKSLSGDISQAF